MWIRKTGLSLLLLINFGAGTVAYADGLSLQQIIDLKSAGIGDQVVVHQIESEGLTFQPDATALLSLRKAGASDAILDAIAKAGFGKPGNSLSAAAQDPVSDLYKAKKYPEVADLLTGKVQANTANDRDRAILVLALLRLDKLEEAKSQLAVMKGLSPPSSYVPKVAVIIAESDEIQRLRKPLDEAIQRLSYKDVVSTIESSQLSNSDKRDMLVDAAVLRADFDAARRLLNSSAGLSYVEINRLKIRQQRLAEQEKELLTAQGNVDRFVYSQGDVSACDGREADRIYVPELGRNADFTIQGYLESVKNIMRLAPLSDDTLNRVFHATMITSKYSDVEAFGDRVLLGAGRLRVTGFGADRFVTLVIDHDNGKLFTEPDSHAVPASSYLASAVPVVPFDLRFQDIVGVSQSARGVFTGVSIAGSYLADGAYALKVAPRGVIPQYPLMALLNCSVGHNAQLTATYNLGAFIGHVASIDHRRMSLVTPGVDRKPGGMGFMTFMAAAGMALGVNNSAAFLQTAQGAHDAAVNAENSRLQLSSAGRFQFSVAQSPSVQELENILNLSEAARDGGAGS